MQNVGLIFKETFTSLRISHVDRAAILNTNSAATMLTGIINGALLRRFGFRKLSIAAAVLLSTGMTLTAFASSFVGYIITYGFVTGKSVSLYFIYFHGYANI